jgi:hypothetical protein
LNFFTNNGGPQITLLQNGNTGIGTINPIAKLHITADGEALRLNGTNPYFTMYNGAGLKGYLWARNANDFEIGTDDSNPSGNLFLSIQEVPALIVQSDRRVRVGALPSMHPSGVGGLPTLTSFGPLCIKDNFYPAADEWSWVAQSEEALLGLTKNGDPRAFIDDDGVWNVFSDATLKENFKVYKEVLSGIKKLQVSTYHYKWNKTDKKSFGLIAQDVAQYFPEIVSETHDKDGKRILGISYAKTGVLAIKAIQEQQEIIEAQQKEIDDLKKRLAALENKLK